METAVLNLLTQVAAEADPDRQAALKAASNDTLRAHFGRYDRDLEEVAFQLLNIAWSDTMTNDIVPQVIDVKTVDLGAVDFVDEDLRGMRAYWQGKGGQILSDVLRYQRTYMPREEMVTALDFHQDEIATDFWGTLDKLIGQAEEKLSQLPTFRLVELVRAAIASGIYYGTFAVSTLTADQIDSVVDQVAARTGGQLSILGTRVAIRYLSDVGLDFGPNVAERVFDTGQVGIYKGYPVVQVEQFQDFAGNFVLPHNELWVVGRNAGRLTYYGSTAKVQQLALPSFMRRWETARDAGMLLYGVQRGRLGRIVFS